MTDWNAFAAALPPHKASLSITHNPHRDYYETVAQHLAWLEHQGGGKGDGFDPGEWISREDFDAAVASNELWVIQVYPNSPVGFYRECGSTLANCMAALLAE